MLKSSGLIFLILASSVVQGAIASAPDLETDDVALIHYIESSDRALKNSVGACFHQRLKRTTIKSQTHFSYTAFCEIKEQQEGECGSYKVHASGIVQSSESARADTSAVITSVSLHLAKTSRQPVEILSLENASAYPSGITNIEMNWKTANQLELIYQGDAHIDFQAVKVANVEVSVAHH